MKNKEKQTKETPKNPKKQIQVMPAAESLSNADLDKVTGGATYSTSRSNIRGAKVTD
jgi:hypothetical protein